MVSRLALVTFLIVAVLWSDARAGIRFGVTPYLSEEDLKASFDPLLEDMAKVIGEEITLVITRDYTDLTDKMAVGDIDFGAFSPFAYVDAMKKTGITVFASHCVNGRPWYQGVMISLKKRGFQSIDQLADKTFAFVDPKSASGFLYPRSLLIREGKNPDLFFGKTFFSGSHDKVIRDVMSGKADAGAVYSDALDMAENHYGKGVFQVLMKTEPIPYDAYVARQGLDPELVEKVQRFFLSLSDTKAPLKQILSQEKGVKFTGWIRADDARYDVVRETAAMSGSKKKIAVLNFSASGRMIKTGKLNDVFSEITSAYLAETNRYDIVPRFKLEEVLLKHGINLTSDLTPELFSLLKREVGLDFIVSGTVLIKDKGLGARCVLNGTGPEQDVHETELTCRSVEEMNDMAVACVTWIQRNIPVEAYVMEVSGKDLTIFGGLDKGFSVNDWFIVVNLGEKEFSKDGAHVTGRKRRHVAEGIFRKVDKETASGFVSGGDINQVDIGSRILVAESAASKETNIYGAYLKGLNALAEDRNEDAVGFFKQVIDLDPAYAMAHARLSTAYYNLNKQDMGKDHLKKAVDHISTITFQERNYIHARLATESGDPDTAKALYQEILNKYPDNTSAMHNLGMLYMNTGAPGDAGRAKRCFENAMAIDPDLTVTRNALAKLVHTKQGIKPGKADIIIVFDTTGSMGQEIKGMIENTEKFVSYLETHRISAALGLISFGDALNDVLFNDPKKPELTTNTSLFVKHLKQLQPKGGGDKPENPYLACERALSYRFRNDSRKIILLITDAPAHMKDSVYSRDTAWLIRELNKHKISVAIIGPPDDHYASLARKTDGVLIDIRSTEDFTKKILQIGETIVHLF